MPTLRFKIILARKAQASVRSVTPLPNFKQTVKKTFNRLISSDSLPYLVAPLVFLVLMYLEWLYLIIL